MVHRAAALDRQSVRLMAVTPDWAKATGDVWADRWPNLDRALSGVSPHLLSAMLEAAPAGAFQAFDIGCGAGTTTISLAEARSDAEIVACDLSPSLAEIAEKRTKMFSNVRVALGDAEALATREGPFDLFYSRHGVMFFPNPVRAFASICEGAKRAGAIVFSCFQGWDENPWASEVASVTAGRVIPAPGREPSGFAFSDPDYVREILCASGWTQLEGRIVNFEYLPGEGPDALVQAISLLTEVGPASAILKALDDANRAPALNRLRTIVEQHFDGSAVRFPGSIWVWTARAAA